MRTAFRRPAAIAILIAVAPLALLAGCGDDGNGNGSGEKESDTAWVLGDWTATLHQAGMPPFRVWAEVRSLDDAAENDVRYSGLECRGTWTPLGGDGDSFRFRETIESGHSEACKGVGVVSLRREEPGLAYRFRGGGVESRGLLRRDAGAVTRWRRG